MLTFVKSFKSNQLPNKEIDFNSGMIGSESDLQTITELYGQLDLNHDKVKMNLMDYSNVFIREHSDTLNKYTFEINIFLSISIAINHNIWSI